MRYFIKHEKIVSELMSNNSLNVYLERVLLKIWATNSHQKLYKPKHLSEFLFFSKLPNLLFLIY